MCPNRHVHRFVSAVQGNRPGGPRDANLFCMGRGSRGCARRLWGRRRPQSQRVQDRLCDRRRGQSQFGADLVSAVQTAPRKTNAQLATEFEQLSARARGEATQLRRLDPPSKYQAQLGLLVTGFGTVRSDLHAISLAAAAGDVTGARDSTVKLLKDADHTRTLDRALTAKLGLRQS